MRPHLGRPNASSNLTADTSSFYFFADPSRLSNSFFTHSTVNAIVDSKLSTSRSSSSMRFLFDSCSSKTVATFSVHFSTVKHGDFPHTTHLTVDVNALYPNAVLLAPLVSDVNALYPMIALF